MKVHPWDDVVAHAEDKIRAGFNVYQQWNCQHCGAKQTMPDANHFYMSGICEECDSVTDIKKNGMNFMTIISLK